MQQKVFKILPEAHPENNPIEISFRTDEKRFDEEGTYNIRYQIVKKG